MSKSYYSLSFFLLLFSLSVLSSPVPLKSIVRQFDQVKNLKVDFRDNTEKVHLSFETYGLQFHYWLTKHHELYTKNSKVIFPSSSGFHIEAKIPNWVYRGMGGEDLSARVTFMHGPNGLLNMDNLVFQGTFDKDNQTFSIEPTKWYKIDEPLGTGVTQIAYRHSDEIPQDCNCGVKHGHHLHADDPFHRHLEDTLSKKKRSIEQTPLNIQNPPLDPPTLPCPTKRALKIVSFAADNTYIQRLGGSREAVEGMINMILTNADAKFQKTINVRLSLDNLLLVLPNDTVPWNSGCSATISDKLNAISKWRDGVAESTGLWHLMTNCYPSGTVGLAWVGQFCLTRGTNARDGGYVNGAAVSSNLVGSNAWRVVTHEMGHNFGAQHAAEGIMTPDLAEYNGFSRPSQDNMCSTIKETNCLVDDDTCKPSCAGRVCGNNGCGGSCGTCPAQHQCFQGACVCLPICGIRECGSNGCNGTCGACPSSTFCADDIGGCLSFSKQESDQIVERHNFFRKALKLPDLKFNNTLAAAARKWTATCSLLPSPPSVSGAYGENFDYGPGMNFTSAIASWGLERKEWLCATRDCRGQCSEYIQMVAAGVTDVGCGQTVCGDVTFISCFYGPAGLTVVQEPFPKESCTTCPTVCNGLGLQCGSIFNGCVDEFCGNCPAGSFCLNGTCLCVNSTSCSSERKNCGPISLTAPTTCAAIPSTCGDCMNGQSCSSGGYCKCKEADCSRAGITCGNQKSACGTYNCGTCNDDNSCQNGVCVGGSGKCVANVTCDAAGLQCGMLTTSCGQTSCGYCAPNEACVSGKCQCQPTTSCKAQGKECGTVYNGCTVENCGTCVESSSCQRGKCTSCAVKCHVFAACDGKNCVCFPGHRGDGVNFCEQIGDLTGVEGLGSQTRLIGGGNWWIGNQIVTWLTSTTSGLLQLDPVYAYHVDSKSTIMWTVRKASEAQAGLAFAVKDSDNFLAIRFGPLQLVSFWSRIKGKDTLHSLGNAPTQAQYKFAQFKLVTEGKKYVVSVDNKVMGGPFIASFPDTVARFGYFGFGEADLGYISTSTQVDVNLKMANCISSAQMVTSLSNILEAPMTQFAVKSRACGPLNQNKRSIEQTTPTAEELTPGTFTVTIKGSDFASAPALALELKAMFMDNFPRVRGNSLALVSVTTDIPFADQPDSFPPDGTDDTGSDDSGGLKGIWVFVIVISVLAGVMLVVFILFLVFKSKDSGGSHGKNMVPLYS